MSDLGAVYVLCFARPFHGANGRHIGARHYIGWTCEPDPTRRLAADLGIPPSGALGRGFEARDLDRRIRQAVQSQETPP